MQKLKSLDSNAFIRKVEMQRKVANSKLDMTTKTELGQFMTPASTSSFMVSLFPIRDDHDINLLDPGSGVGSLTFAFLDRIKDLKTIKKINVDAYEIDKVMLHYLNKNISAFENEINENAFDFTCNILEEDFISAASNRLLQADSLWAVKEKKYTHCIMNPPYRKISSSSLHRKLLRSVGIETVNLYSGFVALSLYLLEKNGYLVAIIPRSFCNGPYYKPFRENILTNSAIKHIHLFESRNKAFKEDKVLQENIIIMLQKNAKQKKVIISTSTDNTFLDLNTTEYMYEQIVQHNDTELIIHIPSAKSADLIVESKYISHSLNEIGIQVSTGPVVDFRLKEFLCKNYEKETTVPLLYPSHFSSMKTIWPLENGKKANAIKLNPVTNKWLFPIGYYTVVRRFSSKEEKRRIVASIVNPKDFEDIKFLGFENHLNVFHINKKGIPEELAIGLAIFLNSKIVDDNFRRFSGHTQVNVSDLKRIKYPNIGMLIDLGNWAKENKEITTEMIDSKLRTLQDARNE